MTYNRSMTTTIVLPDMLVEKSDRLAARLGLSRSELYEMAIAQFVRTEQPKSPTLRERFDAVYQNEDSRLDPLFVEMQARSLPEDEW